MSISSSSSSEINTLLLLGGGTESLGGVDSLRNVRIGVGRGTSRARGVVDLRTAATGAPPSLSLMSMRSESGGAVALGMGFFRYRLGEIWDLNCWKADRTCSRLAL
jgi:hypothetical protein